MCNRGISIILLVIALFSCGDGQRLSLEHQVYEALFNEIMNDATKVVLIGETTELNYGSFVTPESFLEKYPEFIDIRALVFALSKTKNIRSKIDWKPIMINGVFVRLPDGSASHEFQLLLQKNYGTGSYYKVSGVQVDPVTKDALVGISNNCGPLCGFGAIVHLRKVGTSWRIVKQAPLWIS